jgi:hypothetical protein
VMPSRLPAVAGSCGPVDHSREVVLWEVPWTGNGRVAGNRGAKRQLTLKSTSRVQKFVHRAGTIRAHSVAMRRYLRRQIPTARSLIARVAAGSSVING